MFFGRFKNIPYDIIIITEKVGINFTMNTNAKKEDDYKKILARNIKYYRELNNLKAYELGNLIHVSNSTVSGWETGTRSPDINTLVKLSEIFDISLDELVGKKKGTPQRAFLRLKDIFKNEDVSLLTRELTFLTEFELDEIKLTIQLIEQRRKKLNNT